MFNEQDLIFEVGFTNLSNKPVLVNPTLFSSQALSIFPNIKHPESYTMLKPAVDPEWILKDLDANIEKIKTEIRSTEINNSIFMFLDILLAIGSNETDSEKATTRAENQRLYSNNQSHLEASQNQFENTLEAKIKMETLLLRKTTLFPGKTIAGLVHFHRHDESSKFEIHLPVEGRKFSFKYDHVLLAKRL